MPLFKTVEYLNAVEGMGLDTQPWGALGCEYMLSILLISVTYECIFIFFLTLDNVLNKVSNS